MRIAAYICKFVETERLDVPHLTHGKLTWTVKELETPPDSDP